MEILLSSIGLYIVLGGLTFSLVLFLSRMGLADPLFQFHGIPLATVSRSDLIVALVGTVLIWPFILITTLRKIPEHYRRKRYEASPEGKAAFEADRLKRIESEIEPWIPTEWLIPNADQNILDEISDSLDPETIALRKRIQPGDQLMCFSSPPDSWEQLCGRGGIALVRDGKVVAQVVQLMN